MLSAYQTVKPLGWRVFVEEPLSEAYAPLRAAIWRTAVLLVAFLLLAVATGVFLARRLVQPIESIQVAAAKIGSGELDQRIEVQSNDELGALADEFNRMAAQLQESYSGLELKVEERTEELALALNALDDEEPRAGSGQPAQVGVPREHVARAAHTVERDPRVLPGAARGDGRRGQREAGGVPRRHPLVAHHLLSLINDVLDLSKVEAGQFELEIAPFSLRESLERGVVMVRERATKDGVRIALGRRS